LNISKDFSIDIQNERCNIRPIYGEELGAFLRVLNEETKEPS